MMKIARTMMVVLLAFTAPAVLANTAAEKKVAAKVISEKLSDQEALAILETPYDGYVEIRGKAKKDIFSFTKIKSKASYPDGRFEDLAKTIAAEIDISMPVVSGSSRMKPSATAYVFFYKDGVDGVNTAGARQVNVTDGEGDYLALLVIRQKGPRGNVNIQDSGNIATLNQGANKVYKFELDA